MTTRSPWMNRAQAKNKAKGSPPDTFIESNLMDLKGQPITNRILKQDYQGNSAMMQSSLDSIEQEMKFKPDIDERALADNQKNGFSPAGTTTGINPSRQRPAKSGGIQGKSGRRTFQR